MIKKEEEAYAIEEHEITETPAFKVITNIWIISMMESTRRPALLDEIKRVGLTRRVKILLNKGFRKVPKEGVHSTSSDLLHANKYICRIERDNPLPVCIFEDDVEFVASGKTIAKRIEHLVLNRTSDPCCRRPPPPSATLGALIHLGAPSSLDDTDGIINVFAGANAHAMIYTPAARMILMRLPFSSRPHDLEIYEAVELVAPKWPLAVQRHHRTENSFAYDPTGLFCLICRLLNSPERPVLAYNVFHGIGAYCGGTLSFALVLLSVILACTLHV